MHGGIADSVKIESEDNGFHLVVESDEGTFIFNVHGIASEILQEVQRTIGEWWAEGQAAKADFERGRQARAEYDREVYDHERQTGQHAPFECAPEDIDESGGYDISDPKHPEFHSVHADIWDSRAGK